MCRYVVAEFFRCNVCHAVSLSLSLCVCVCVFVSALWCTYVSFGPNVNVCVGMSSYSFCSCVVPSIGFYCFENSCVHLFCRCFNSYSRAFVVEAAAAALTAIAGKSTTPPKIPWIEGVCLFASSTMFYCAYTRLCITNMLNNRALSQSRTRTHTDRHTCCSFVDYFPLFFILYFVRFLLLLLLLFCSSHAASVCFSLHCI